MRPLTIPSPIDSYFHQTYIFDFEWDLFTEEEFQDIYDSLEIPTFQGPHRPPLQGPMPPP